jgi:hypothetical protein
MVRFLRKSSQRIPFRYTLMVMTSYFKQRLNIHKYYYNFQPMRAYVDPGPRRRISVVSAKLHNDFEGTRGGLAGKPVGEGI